MNSPRVADRPGPSRFLRFSLVGTFGFAADTSVLYALLYGAGGGYYLSRLFSYLTAVTATWWLNRRYTFSEYAGGSRGRQWLKFVAYNALGGLANYGVYSAGIAVLPLVQRFPVLGVAAGSVAGLAVNFTVSRRFVFVWATGKAAVVLAAR
jgi:putative flippase GtrA